MKGLILCLLCLGFLQGCELLNRKSMSAAEVKSVDDHEQTETSEQTTALPEDYCFVQSKTMNGANVYQCDISGWLDYWVEHNSLSWPKRRDMIEELGDTENELMMKILLSQSKGTPYQNRLRAQAWVDQLLPKLTDDSKLWLNLLVYHPSQQLLEFESALTILTRINTNQAKEIEAQENRIKEQQQQIEQLLKIEASMMEKREGIKQ